MHRPVGKSCTHRHLHVARGWRQDVLRNRLRPWTQTAPGGPGQPWASNLPQGPPAPTDLKVAVQRRAASYTKDRPRTLVQLEPTRTASIRAANAVGVRAAADPGCLGPD